MTTKLFNIIGVFVLITQSSPKLQATIATDSPTNYTTATWTNGANMGSGFTPWEFTNNTPETIPPTPLSEIFNVDPENWAPEVSWNIMSTTNGTSSAFRGFKSLEIGDQIYTKFKIDSVDEIASRVGFRLYNNNELLYFVQYEDENDRWNFNGTMFWSGTNLTLVTEFIWGRSANQEIDIFMKYDGETRMSVQGAYWTNAYPNRIEIFSEYQGTDTGGIGLLELNAPAIPEPKVALLIALSLLLYLMYKMRKFIVTGPRYD
jgi:hypothetical protein